MISGLCIGHWPKESRVNTLANRIFIGCWFYHNWAFTVWNIQLFCSLDLSLFFSDFTFRLLNLRKSRYFASFFRGNSKLLMVIRLISQNLQDKSAGFQASNFGLLLRMSGLLLPGVIFQFSILCCRYLIPAALNCKNLIWYWFNGLIFNWARFCDWVSMEDWANHQQFSF